MSSALERRLAIVERRVMPSSRKPLVIIVRGGLTGGEPVYAAAGDLRWERAPGEPLESFKTRAAAEASAAGKALVVVGGLPPRP
jgi:hypothetical protein